MFLHSKRILTNWGSDDSVRLKEGIRFFGLLLISHEDGSRVGPRNFLLL